MSVRDVPRVLSIAGTDPTGGAGIQADLKSIAANGGYGMAVVTALVAQNTHGVRSVHTPPAGFLREQLDAVSDDVVIDAVKIGMLGSTEVARTVGAWLAGVRPPAVVLDPVMVASSGDRLLSRDAENALRGLLHRVDLVTPNLPELAALLEVEPAQTWERALDQGRRLSGAYNTAVLVKGGHLAGSAAPDALVMPGGDGLTVSEFSSARVETKNTHGTGCSLSSAVATLFARTGSWVSALGAAKAWLQEALETADLLEVGTGHGPVNHFAGPWQRGLAPLPLPSGTGVPPRGERTAGLWSRTADVRERIASLDFVRGLGDGSLDQAVFARYLAQDAIYLRGYARALSRASELAPTLQEQLFWAESASGALEAELELHRNWLHANTAGGGLPGTGKAPADPAEGLAAGPVTRGYLDHLLGTDRHRGDRLEYARLVGAVLPCFWVYAEAGAALAAGNHASHPYREWLDTYADPAFAAATARAVGILEDVLAGDDAQRRAAGEAFALSVQWEHDFFAAG
ncbi:bifunctional hydroxymethylpyrimidine kinase/phosphomethylpyrimidine kinase [Arthrobacter gandavensis]|nr:bifunctional hydroxymethylpyrimidine kinase/phosphomethylpyrimidine kinase [Arthrobacter gandavensis]